MWRSSPWQRSSAGARPTAAWCPLHSFGGAPYPTPVLHPVLRQGPVPACYGLPHQSAYLYWCMQASVMTVCIAQAPACEVLNDAVPCCAQVFADADTRGLGLNKVRPFAAHVALHASHGAAPQPPCAVPCQSLQQSCVERAVPSRAHAGQHSANTSVMPRSTAAVVHAHLVATHASCTHCPAALHSMA